MDSIVTLKARVELTYQGTTYQPGWIFSAVKRDALVMINSDEADPFNLQDPSTTPTLAQVMETLPNDPPVTLNPTSATVPAAGALRNFGVTVVGAGQSGTWMATVDAGSWISITSPTAPQPTPGGQVVFNVPANSGAQRVDNIYVNDQTFVVSQDAGSMGDVVMPTASSDLYEQSS